MVAISIGATIIDEVIRRAANSSYRSYQRFEHINEAKGSFSIVLTL